MFCFNPNEDIGTIASSLGWDQAKQEKKWLQVYNTVVAQGQKKNAVKRGTGIVHIVWNGDPPENTDAAWTAAEQDPPGLVCPHSRSFTVGIARSHKQHFVARSEIPKLASCSAPYWLDSQWKMERWCLNVSASRVSVMSVESRIQEKQKMMQTLVLMCRPLARLWPKERRL